jgi:acetyl-CoA carboxylase biotin carboxyl carrier protein
VLRRVDADLWVQETTVLAEPVLLSVAGSPTQETSPGAISTRAEDGCVDICAPLPGIFYRAPKPGAAPFVETGSCVSADTVVGIIETMKLMNSVASGAAGEIVEICVVNGTQVEALDVIMRVLPGPVS